MAFFYNFYSVEWFLGGVLISLIYATPTSFAVYVIGLLIKHITRKKLKVNWKEFFSYMHFFNMFILYMFGSMVKKKTATPKIQEF